MLTTVDRVIAKLTLKHPMSDARSAAVQDEAAQFAAKLMENYKGHLIHRPRSDQQTWSQTS